MSLYDKEDLVRRAKPPRIVFIGSSYIGRLKDWYQQILEEDGDSVYQYVLGNSRFAYSGGATWENLWDRVNGKRLPKWQHQGDTYGEILNDKSFKAQYCFLVCGSNSIDRINDNYFHKWKNSTEWQMLHSLPYGPSKFYRKRHWHDRFERGLAPINPGNFDEKLFFEKATVSIHSEINAALSNIKHDYDKQKFYGLCIVQRHNWFPAIRCFAMQIDFYLSNVFVIKMCQINGFLKPAHFETDRIHVNQCGYEIFMDKAVRVVVDHHVGVEIPSLELSNGMPMKPLCKSTLRRKRKAQRRREEKLNAKIQAFLNNK